VWIIVAGQTSRIPLCDRAAERDAVNRAAELTQARRVGLVDTNDHVRADRDPLLQARTAAIRFSDIADLRHSQRDYRAKS
jgi:hypothetical protein